MANRTGAGGRPRTPTEMKLIQGTARPDRVHADEPKPLLLEADTPAPSYLKPTEKAVWKDVLPLLRGMRVASQADQTAIALICAAFARWQRAYKLTHVKDFSPVYSTTQDNGSIVYKEHPAVMQEERASKLLMESLREFGMTPSARARVHAIPEQNTDRGPRPVGEPPPFDEWMAGPTQ